MPGYEGGYYVGPTIFDGCTPDMTICQDEIFGPVAAIVRVADLDEALAITNASPYGNEAVIYTTNGASARRFWYEAEAGNIGVNIGVAAPVAYFPFAGMKDSHFGNGYGAARLVRAVHREEGRHHPLVDGAGTEALGSASPGGGSEHGQGCDPYEERATIEPIVPAKHATRTRGCWSSPR